MDSWSVLTLSKYSPTQLLMNQASSPSSMAPDGSLCRCCARPLLQLRLLMLTASQVTRGPSQRQHQRRLRLDCYSFSYLLAPACDVSSWASEAATRQRKWQADRHAAS